MKVSAKSSAAGISPHHTTNVTPLDHEWSVLFGACSITPNSAQTQEKQVQLRNLLQQPIRWKSLLTLADQHGAQPLLFQALSAVAEKFPSLVPRDAMLALQQNHQSNLRKSLLLSRELIAIVDRFSSVGIEVMPYKGLALAEAVYGDIALRQSGDIDLLIHAKDFHRVREELRDLGFTPHTMLSEAQERAYLKSGYEYSFDGTAGPNLLEVQWAIQPRFYAIDFDMPGLFQRAMNITVAGHAMRTPSAEDLFLVLSAHAAKHVWGRMIWLCDLARIMTLPNLNWQWIDEQARALGIVRILRVTILLARRFLGAEVPDAALHTGLVEDDSVASALMDEVHAHIVSGITYNVESVSYFRLMMRLRERSDDRRQFLQRLILTAGPGEWEVVRLPEPFYPLYSLIRLCRLAARFLR